MHTSVASIHCILYAVGDTRKGKTGAAENNVQPHPSAVARQSSKCKVQLTDVLHARCVVSGRLQVFLGYRDYAFVYWLHTFFCTVVAFIVYQDIHEQPPLAGNSCNHTGLDV